MKNPLTEKIAKLFHTYYEELAPRIGYAAVPWKAMPACTKELMLATVGAVLDHLAREADFEDGVEVECIIPIPNGGDGPFVKKGERGRVSMQEGAEVLAVVLREGGRTWYAERSTAALHFRRCYPYEQEEGICSVCGTNIGWPCRIIALRGWICDTCYHELPPDEIARLQDERSGRR